MIDPNPSNATPIRAALGGTERALLQRIREVAGAGARDRSRKELASDLGTSEATTRRALQRLEVAGLITVQRVPGMPSAYHPTESAQQVGSGRLNGSAQVGSSRSAQVGSFEPTSRAEPGDNLEGSGKSGTQELENPSRAREAEPTEPTEPTQHEPTVQGVGQAAVGWAIAAQQRLGKPTLSPSLLKKVGSQAKRMSDDGTDLRRLQAAVEQLVAGGHTDLLLADGKAQANAAAQQFVGVLRSEATTAGRRDQRARVEEPHTEAELAEVFAYMAGNWSRSAQYLTPAMRAAWHRDLRELPVEGIYWALEVYGRRAGGEYLPTSLQIKEIGITELRRVQQRRIDAEHQRAVHDRIAAQGAA